MCFHPGYSLELISIDSEMLYQPCDTDLPSYLQALCRRDIPYLSSGVNIVMIKSVGYEGDNTARIDAFTEAGIYIIVKMYTEPRAPFCNQALSSLEML